MLTLRTNPTHREQQQFVMIWLPAFFGLLGLVVYWRLGAVQMAGVIWSLGIVLTALGVLLPRLRRPLFMGWMAAMYPIGWTVSHLVLAAIFYLMVTPLGLLLRLVRDPLQRQFDRSAPSYWVARRARARVSDYFKQY